MGKETIINNSVATVDSMFWIMPELILVGGTLLILLLDLFCGKKSRAALVAVVTLFLSGVALCLTHSQTPQMLFEGMIVRDPFSDFWKILFLIAAASCGILASSSRETLSPQRDSTAEFYALMLASTVGLFVMVSAHDLLIAYVGLEFVSILGFVLVGYKKHNRGSSEAALKYAVYSGVASSVMLYGFSLLYGMATTTSFTGLGMFPFAEVSPDVLIIAIIFVLAGFGYKMAVVPFHQWCPDVYQGAPTLVTAFLSVAPKAAGFALLTRFVWKVLMPDMMPDSLWLIVFGIVAMVTMTIGNLMALVQTNIKRLLAYSSIAHAGTALLGLLAFMAGHNQSGLISPEMALGLTAMMFYFVVYMLMNIGFLSVIHCVSEQGVGESLCDYHKLGYRAPYLAGVGALFLVALAGLPPTAGFGGKFLIFTSLFDKGNSFLYGVAFVGLINIVISLFYYAGILKVMYLGHPQGNDDDIGKPLIFDRRHQSIVIPFATLLLFFGVFWNPLIEYTERMLLLW